MDKIVSVTRWLLEIVTSLHIILLKLSVALGDKAADRAYEAVETAGDRLVGTHRMADTMIAEAKASHVLALSSWEKTSEAAANRWRAADAEAKRLRPSVTIA